MTPLLWNEWLVVGLVSATLVGLFYFEHRRRYLWQPEIIKITQFSTGKDSVVIQPLWKPHNPIPPIRFRISQEDDDIASYGVGGANFTPESTQIPPDTIERRR